MSAYLPVTRREAAALHRLLQAYVLTEQDDPGMPELRALYARLADAPQDHSVYELPHFRCPVCAAVSFNPGDREHGYCARCHRFTGVTGGNTPGPVS